MMNTTQLISNIKNSIALFTVVAVLASTALNSHHVSAQTQSVFVIVNAKSNINLNKQQIRNVFMGSAGNLGLDPVNLPPGELSRTLFNLKVVGLTEARIQSYWAQMRFSGRMKPPVVMESESEILAFVSQNPDAIAYVSSTDNLPDTVKVLAEID